MVTKFVESSTETRGGFGTLEAAHGSVSSLDPAMVLLNSFIQILVGAVFHGFAQFGPDRARITVVTVGRDARRSDAGHHSCRSEEQLRRLHVPGLAQSDVDERAETINGAIKTRRRRSSSIRAGVSFASQSRTASWLNSIPRIRNISGRSRRLSLYRRRQNTTSAMTSERY